MISVDFTSFDKSVPAALDALHAADALARQKAILIKPNLINDSPPPVTTPAACCEALVRYVRACSNASIAIGEGCGTPALETDDVFDRLGYRDLAKRLGVKLVDLNKAPLSRRTDPSCSVFPEMYLPDMALSHYLISVPVLKAHSLADITGTLKNMIGLAPPKHYSGRHGVWRKAAFHGRMQQSIVEINRYRTPDLTLMDASVGLADYHLGGPECEPPVRKLLAGFDPLELDRAAAELLGLDWRRIGHLAGAEAQEPGVQ